MARHDGLSAAVVVVGGGTAGCALAARLAAAGRDVLVLEAGPDPGPLGAGNWPADLLDATTLATSHDWGYGGPAADGRHLSFERARVLGGCSAHNGSTMSVGWHGDHAELPTGWTADDLAPARARATAQTRVVQPPDHLVQPFQHAFLDACAATGMQRTDDLLDPRGGAGVSVSPVNIVDGTRFNSAVAYLDEVRHLPNLRIVGDCLVDRVELRAGAVAAVHALRGTESISVHADCVVLAAGAYGTPAVLLRSGIGPAAHLRSLDIPVLVELPGVGSTLQDHPVVRLEWAATPLLVEHLAGFAAEHGFLPEEQCVAKASSGLGRDGAPYDCHVFPWVEPDPTHTWRCVLPIGLLRPHSSGTVRLDDRDPATAPRIDHGYLSHHDDARRLVAPLAWLAELVRTPALTPYLGAPLRLPELDTAHTAGDGPGDGLVDWARRHHEHYWHPTGGACLGGDGDPLAVCDARAGVRGVTGLYVADASLFPRAPRATPALAVTTIGEHVAGLLLADAATGATT